jgi:hypothetical protein
VSEILATVELKNGYLLDLFGEGWRLRGIRYPGFELLVNMAASLDDYGPADGDPFTLAANRCADVFCGKVLFVTTLESPPPGSVY